MTRIKTGYDRRRILQGMAGGITAAGGMTLFGPAVHAAKTIKIGYVSPKSGPLAAFARRVVDERVLRTGAECLNARQPDTVEQRVAAIERALRRAVVAALDVFLFDELD